jgi:hypothetical protein
MSNIPASDPAVTSALLDLVRAGKALHTSWALIGGQALISYGVPRHTEDTDLLVPHDELERFASTLVETFGYAPLVYDADTEAYVEADDVTVHYMDDPVLFDIHQERALIPLRSPLGLDVELLAAQHPVEKEMISHSLVRRHFGVSVPVSPLGGILLVKMKADRHKDVAAIEQTAESLPSTQMQEALQWAEKRDHGTAEDLRSVIGATKTRRVPQRTKSYPRK